MSQAFYKVFMWAVLRADDYYYESPFSEVWFLLCWVWSSLSAVSGIAFVLLHAIWQYSPKNITHLQPDAPPGSEATEARVRSAAIACKAFMRFEVGAEERAPGPDGTDEVLSIWVRILDYLDAIMRVDQSDQMVGIVVLTDTHTVANVLSR